MKKNIILLSLLLASMIATAKNGKPDAICINDGGVEVRIEKLAYDARGAVFQGTITKNGRLIRNSSMRKALVSNGFVLYALGKDGRTSWSFNVNSLRSANISDQTDYLSIARELGYSNTQVICDRNLPLGDWRK
jgi:hypothetical protein